MFELLATFPAALIFDASNGLHDAPNVTAPLVGTQTLNRRQAVAWNVLWTVVPGFIAGTGVASTVGAGLLAASALIPPLVIPLGLAAAIGWNFITWRRGIPSSSSYALLAGLAGTAGLNSVIETGSVDPVTAAKAFVAPFILSGWVPVLAWMMIAPLAGYAAARTVIWTATHASARTAGERITKKAAPLTRAIVTTLMPANGRARAWTCGWRGGLLRPANRLFIKALAAADRPLAWVEKRLSPHMPFRAKAAPPDARPDATPNESRFTGTATQYLLLVSSAFFSAAHASNDAMKTAGVLTAALHSAGYLAGFAVQPWVVGVSFAAMALGTALGGARIERTQIGKLGRMTPRRAACAQIIAGAAVAAAGFFKVPLSSTLAYTAANAGANEPTAESRQTIKDICARWVITMPASGAMGAGLIALAHLVPTVAAAGMLHRTWNDTASYPAANIARVDLRTEATLPASTFPKATLLTPSK